jgi:hypothetical protein
MSRGRSEAHPLPKVKHDRISNGRIILFMLASSASSAVGCHDESGPSSFIDWQSKNDSSALPEMAKWQRIGNQINAAFIFTRAYFVTPPTIASCC